MGPGRAQQCPVFALGFGVFGKGDLLGPIGGETDLWSDYVTLHQFN